MSDYDEIRKALTYLDANERDFWVKIGAAVKDELGDNGFELWDEWSQQSANYKPNDAKSVWKSLKAGHIHIGTLFYHARENGYRPEKPYTPPSPEEMAKRSREAQEKQRLEQERIAQAHAKAAKSAFGIWNHAEPAKMNHAYVQHKGLNAESLQGIRQNEYQGKKQLVIPLYSDKKLVNIQTIDEDGVKKFLSGGQKQGAYTIIGDFKNHQQGIVMVEGFATGASVHQATGKPVVVAFDAGNLKAVSEKLLNMLPKDTRIEFAADNDVSQTGLKKAQAAAEVWGERATIRLPEFTAEQIQSYQQQYGSDKMPSDFNDLHQLAGIDAVRAALLPEMQHSHNQQANQTIHQPTNQENQTMSEPKALSQEEKAKWASQVIDAPEEDREMLLDELSMRGINVRWEVQKMLEQQAQEQTQHFRQPEPPMEPEPVDYDAPPMDYENYDFEQLATEPPNQTATETTVLSSKNNPQFELGQAVKHENLHLTDVSLVVGKNQDSYLLLGDEPVSAPYLRQVDGKELTNAPNQAFIASLVYENKNAEKAYQIFEQNGQRFEGYELISKEQFLKAFGQNLVQEQKLPEPPQQAASLENTQKQPELNIIRKNFEHEPASQEVQNRVIQLAQEYPQELINAYKRMDNTFNGRYIASDMMKEVFEDFRQSPAHRNQFNNAVHNTAATLAAEHFKQMLNQPITDGRDTVVFLTGCPGAGKTTSVMNDGTLKDHVGIVFEGQLANAYQNAATVDKIQQAIDKGYKVEIIAVNPLPEQALENTFKRYYDPNDGRGAPISTMARIQGNTYDGLSYLHEKFGNQIDLTIMDKPHGNQETIKYTGWQYLDVLKSQGTEAQITQRLETHLLKHFEQGTIDYECFKQSAGTTERTQQLLDSRMVGSLNREQQTHGNGRGVSPRSSEASDLQRTGYSGNREGGNREISSTQSPTASPATAEVNPPTAASAKDVAVPVQEKSAPELNGIEYDGTRQTVEPPKPIEPKPNPEPTFRQPETELPRPETLIRKQPILDFNYELPEHLKVRYVVADAQKFRVAEHQFGSHSLRYVAAENPKTVLFEDKGKSLHTAQSDRQTIQDMLEIAKVKGWDSIKISGSQEFKQQMWLEAESRGIATRGYKPSPEDLALLDRRRAERSTNSIAEAERLKQQSAVPEHVGSNSKTIPAEAIKAADDVKAQASPATIAKEQYQSKFNTLDIAEQKKASFSEKIALAILERLPEQSREKAMQHFYDNQAEKIHDGKFHAPEPMREVREQQQEPSQSQHHSHDDDLEMER